MKRVCLEFVPSEPATPAQKHAASELSRQIEIALNQLDVSSREAIILSRVSGMSCKEIAKVLEISESNVRVRIHRGLTKMKEALEP